MTVNKARTLPFQKHDAALAWCAAHHKELPLYSKWRAMHKETLYGFLESMNVRWSPARKEWRRTDPMKHEAVVTHNSFSAGVTLTRHVSVRITAASDVMDEVLAEFTELCEALSWHVRVSPKKYPNGNAGYERVYIEIDRTRD
jgi:hypothetical protein